MIAVLNSERTINILAKDSAASLGRLNAIARGEPVSAGLATENLRIAFRIQALKTAADMWTLHKISVLSAQETSNVDEIAKIWLMPMKTFEAAFDAINQLLGRTGVKNSDLNRDLEELQNIVIDLRDQARWAYELHSGGDPETKD
jgi:hypothetical protein